MTAFRVMQIFARAAVAARVVEGVRVLCVRGPPAVGSFLRGVRALSREAARELVTRAEGTLVARAIGSAFAVLPEEADVALEEGFANAETEATERLSILRIAATGSSFLGFVATALAMSGVRSADFGFLALDPAGVWARGMQNAALSIALGAGGASFAFGSWMALRARALQWIRDRERAVEELRSCGAGVRRCG